MKKTATLNLRVDPSLKKEAESVLSDLGIPVSVAVDMYLHQIVLTGGIPFSPTLPRHPAEIDATQMDDKQLRAKLEKGYRDYRSGKVKNAKEVFTDFMKQHE